MSGATRNRPGTIFAWCLYDWANSAFTTLVVTFIYATYFARAIVADDVRGPVLWSRGITATALTIALLSPVLGAYADRSGSRRRLLLAATALCVATTAALTFVSPGLRSAIPLALGLFVIANVAFEMQMVFYNAYLPTIVTPDRIGRVSGYGWGLGYVGGLACMVVALLGFVSEPGWFGVSRTAGFHVRATNLLVAGWLAVFSIPLFLLLPEGVARAGRPNAGGALKELWRTFQELRRFREAATFLLARLLYNDGIVTIFALGGVYASVTFGMSETEILQFGIVLNVAAGLGALAFGFVDDWIGAKSTVIMSLVALSAGTGMAVLAPTRSWLWAAGILIGLFAGPNQAASRSLMSRFSPADRQNEFFGFFAFSGKATSFLGPLLLGIATATFASMRAGVAVVFVLLVLGGLVLLAVDETKGMAAASEAEPSTHSPGASE